MYFLHYCFVTGNFSIVMRLSKNPKNKDFGAFYGLQVRDFIRPENRENVTFGLFRQSLYNTKRFGVGQNF